MFKKEHWSPVTGEETGEGKRWGDGSEGPGGTSRWVLKSQ